MAPLRVAHGHSKAHWMFTGRTGKYRIKRFTKHTVFSLTVYG